MALCPYSTVILFTGRQELANVYAGSLEFMEHKERGRKDGYSKRGYLS